MFDDHIAEKLNAKLEQHEKAREDRLEAQYQMRRAQGEMNAAAYDITREIVKYKRFEYLRLDIRKLQRDMKKGD